MTAELRCKVYPGMFSSEFAVVVEAFNGRIYSLFADRDKVRASGTPTLDEPTEGWLKVSVLEGEGDNILVQLPQTTIENGRFLSVRDDQLCRTTDMASV
jgi:hypothetical protein